jgi:hypothetical protein
MRIELHIDRVILDGVGDPRQVTAIQEALHAELSRLLTTARPRGSRRERRISAPTVTLDPAGSPAALGRAIAGSVHTGLSAPVGRRSGR